MDKMKWCLPSLSIFEFHVPIYSATEDDNTLAVKQNHRYASKKCMTILQSLLNNEQKYFYNETRQKEREHPDDSGKTTNTTYRHKISLAQKEETVGAIKGKIDSYKVLLQFGVKYVL